MGVIARYAEYLPINEGTPRIDLGEGSTPLVLSQRIGPALGLDLFFKLENCNPSGSFKDRGMVFAVAKALESGAKAVMCASTGNTAASAAAYAAASGIDCFVLLPEGRIAPGKMTQSVAYGAHIIEVEGNFDATLRLARELAERHPIALVNSLNPNRIEGQKTAAFEIVDELGTAPEQLFIPVGNAGNITAYWRGFCEYQEAEKARTRPRMMGFQAAGAAPIVKGEAIADPETVASAIRIGNPASWQPALEARDESGGAIASVTDEEILDAYQRLAREEGIFCEPASAACVAGLIKTRRAGAALDGTNVCVLTGSGLKDPETATGFEATSYHAQATVAAVEGVLAL